MLRGHNRDMTTTEIGVIRSKVKFILVTKVSLIIVRTVYHRDYIFHMLTGPGKRLPLLILC